MDSWGLWWLKRKRLLRLSGRQLWIDATSAISTRTAIFQVASLFAFAYLGVTYLGADRMMEELPILGAQAGAALIAAAVVVVVVVITAPWRAARAEAERGKWFGPKFVYHEPRLALTTLWSPEDNGSYVDFVWRDAEPNSFVSYKVEIDGGANRTQAVVHHRFGEIQFSPNGVRYGGSGGIRVNKRREMRLHAYSLPQTVTVTIRVYITSFEVGPVPIATRQIHVGNKR